MSYTDWGDWPVLDARNTTCRIERVYVCTSCGMVLPPIDYDHRLSLGSRLCVYCSGLLANYERREIQLLAEEPIPLFLKAEG